MRQRGKTEPSKGCTSLDGPILPPCCSSPHYIPFKHSDAQVLLSLLCSTIVIVTISELTHISDIHKSQSFLSIPHFYLPSYLCGKHKETTERERRHCGTEVSLQSQGTTAKCNGSETSTNERGSSKGFCVLEQCCIL